jgi:hypothetical protein
MHLVPALPNQAPPPVYFFRWEIFERDVGIIDVGISSCLLRCRSHEFSVY